MTDVFISYSRKDKDFVQTLHHALAAEGRDIWVDWEDIPLTADWWTEIQRGIEAANTFVFVISPDSATSTVCGQELDHAINHNKRIVPVVYRNTDAPPEKITHLNWIFVRDSDNFENAFKSLLQTMDTDLDWIKAHTRLTQRAVEWDQHMRNDSYLFHGVDLAEAKKLLAQTDKKPPLTDLQKQYVIASQTSAVRRKRLTLAGLGVGLLLAVLLIIAFWQFLVANEQRGIAITQQQQAEQAKQEAISQKQIAEQERAAAEEARQDAENQKQIAEQQRAEAEKQKERAEQSEQLATSRELSTQAQLHLDIDPELSILLTLHAISTTTTQQAQSLLQHAVHNSHIEKTVPLDQLDFANIVINPKQRQAAISKRDNTVGIINTDTGQEINTLSGHNALVLLMTFATESPNLATADDTGEVIVWDTQTGQDLLKLASDDDNPVAGLALNDNGNLLAVGYQDGAIDIWAVAAGQQQQQLAGYNEAITAMAFSRDSQQLAVADNGLEITIWDIATGNDTLALSGHEAPVTALTFNSDGTKLASASEDKTAIVWDLTSEDETTTFIGHSDAVQSVSINESTDMLVTGSRDNTAKVWDIASGEVNLTLVGHKSAVNSALFAPEGVIITASRDGTIKYWRMVSEDINTGYRQWVTSIDWSPDGRLLASVAGDGGVRLWDIAGKSNIVFPTHQEWVSQIAFSPEGDRLATASDDSTVEIWPVKGGPPQIMTGHTDWVNTVAWHPNGQILASGGADNTLIFWDTASLEALLTIEMPDWVSNVAWHPDGERLAAALSSGQIVLVNSNGEPIMTLEDHAEWVHSVDFSPDGALLASGSDDGTIKVWVAETGQLLHTLAEHTDPVYDVDFSPDGKRLASAGQDKSVIIWDVYSGQATLKYSEHTNAIQSVAFHPDGSRLATGSRDRSVRLFLLDLEALQNTAISRLSRWWTPKECRQFLQSSGCPPEPENLRKPAR